MNDLNEQGNSGHSGYLKLLLFLSFACAALLLVALTPVGGYFSKERITGAAASMGYWGPLVIIAAAIVTPLLFLPRWPVAWAAGLLYGITFGTVLATVASTLGAIVHYALARSLLAPSARKTLNRFRIDSDSIPDNKMFYFFFFLRAFPLSNSVATNLLAGAIKVRPAVYISATLLGMIPSTFMYASWGKVMKERTSSFSLVAVLSAGFILLGCIVAQKKFVPWLKALRSD